MVEYGLFEGAAVGLFGVGEANDCPSQGVAVPAAYAGHMDDGVAEFSFDACDADGSWDNAIAGDIFGLAGGTRGFWVMEVVEYLILLSFGAYEVVISQSEIAADECFGHGLLPRRGGVLPR